MGSILFLTALTVTAWADPFSGLAARGHAQFGVSVYGSRDNDADGDTEDKYGDTSFYAGVGGFASISSVWDYSYENYIGTDENGDAIFETITEQQSESGYAQGNAYGRFDRGVNTITAEVYAYTTTETNFFGSQAYCGADAFAYSSIDVTFSLTNWTSVQLFSSTSYGAANITLYRDGEFVLDSNILYGLGGAKTALAPGSYQLIGDTNYGGADFSIQAVPEPASMAALGLGAAALVRRRKR